MPRPSAAAAAEHQRGAGRRVDLLVVVHLEDLDVVVVVERRRHALDQSGEQIDAEAHISGLDDGRALARLRDQRFLFGGMAGGADDVHEAGGGGQLGEGERRGGNGELDQAVGSLEQRRNVAHHRDAVGAQSGQLAGIAADHRGARRIDGAGQRQALGRRDRMDQRAPHAPAGTRNHHPHVAIGHGISSQSLVGIAT